MKNNIISIVIPTFNSERYLESAIKSILIQNTTKSIEIIVVDGGSMDKTTDILKKYENFVKGDHHNFKFKWISEKDDGMYDAINKGMKMSSGDIMTYLGSDDIFMPGSLQVIGEAFDKFKDINWITGWPNYIDKNDTIIKTYPIQGYDQKFIKKGYYKTGYLHYIQQEGTFWTRNLWEKINGRIDSQYKLAGDYYLSVNFAKYEHLFTLHSPLAGFRIHSGQLHSNFFKIYEKETMGILNLKPAITEKVLFNLYKIYNNLPLRLRISKYFNKKMPALSYDLESHAWKE